MTDDNDIRRRRALYRATHRGTKEMDVMIGRFAESTLPTMANDRLDTLESLLALPDPLLQSWILAPATVSDITFRSLIDDIRTFHGLNGQPA